MSVVTPYQNELLERDLEPTDSAWGFFNCGDILYMSTRSFSGVRGLGSLNGTQCKTPAQTVSETHQMLAFTMYIRQAAAKVLSKPGRTIRPMMDGRKAVLRISPPIQPEEAPPWSPLYNQLENVSILANVKKMKCPSFSLPAASARFGGSCPGSTLGQTIEPESVLRGSETKKLRIARLSGLSSAVVNNPDQWYSLAVCQYCYAIKGGYSYFSKQVGQVALMLWTQSAVADGTFAPIMKHAIEVSPDHVNEGIELLPKPYTRVFRLHDAGDFFSEAYTRAWKEIADYFNPHVEARAGEGKGTPTIFWAPTRLWATGGSTPKQKGAREWLAVFEGAGDFKQSNMIVRPSGFHSNAHAPLPVAGEVAGSTVHIAKIGPEENALMRTPRPGFRPVRQSEPDPILKKPLALATGAMFDYVCPASRKGAASKNCLDVIGPDGKTRSCRACWVQPLWTISYHIH